MHIQHSGCPFLEQATSGDSQRIVVEILQDTSGRHLAVAVFRGAHITYLLPQPIPSVHMIAL